MARRTAKDLTTAEVADVIERFVEGKTSHWEWDDFTSVHQKDPTVEKARLKCIAVRDEFPSSSPREYCSGDGLEALRDIARQLRRLAV
jgi:hypothetical protein